MLLLELSRRLNNSDPQVRYVLTYLYEIFNEQQKQLNMMTNVVAMQAQQIGQILEKLLQTPSAHMAQQIKELQDFGKTEGVDVSSIATDPEKGET